MQEILRQTTIQWECIISSKVEVKSISDIKKVVVHKKISSENESNASQAEPVFII